MLSFQKSFAIILLISAVIAAPFSAMAQDAPELSKTYTSPDNTFSIDYPAGWQARAGDEDAFPFIFFSNDEAALESMENRPGTILVGVVAPRYVGLIFDTEEDALPRTPRAFLDKILEEFDDFTTLSEIDESKVGELRAARITVVDDDGEGVVLVADLDDGDLAALIGYATPGEFEPFEETVLAIAASMQFRRPDPTFVPDLSETYESEDLDLSVAYPLGWAVEEDSTGGSLTLATSRFALDNEGEVPGEATIYIANAAILQEQIPFTLGDTPVESLENLLSGIDDDDSELVVGEIEAITLGDLEAAWATIHDEETEGLVLFVEYGDGQSAALSLTVYPGDTELFQSTFLAIAATLQPFLEE